MHSNRYITIYTLVMAFITSVVLALVVNVLKPKHTLNEEIFKKKEILGAIKQQLGTDPASLAPDQVFSLFNEKISQVVIDAQGNEIKDAKAEEIDLAVEEKKPADQRKYPLFIFKGEQGNVYLMSMRGNGLWDKIWGYIALEADGNTVSGAAFGHISETPGLGAEIKDNPLFAKQFEGKHLFKGNDFVSIALVKGGVRDINHQVDAISGATITSNGVTDMLKKGITPYLPFFEKIKKS